MRKIHIPSTIVKTILHSKFSGLAALLIGTVFLLIASPQALYRKAIYHFKASAAPKQQGCCSNQPVVLRRMIGTYYTTEGNFKSTLILNNKGPNQIMVTPILHGQNGQTYNAPPVAVDNHFSTEVDLNAIAASAGPQFRSGSFEFTYSGRLLEIGGGLRIVDDQKSLIFHEQMLEPGIKFSSPKLEAVYSIPFESAKASAIITNTTPQPLLVAGGAIFTGNKNQPPIQGLPIQGVLKPYETQIVNLSQSQGREILAGAVSLNHNGGKGALLAMIHVWDPEKGYSQSVNFSDPSHGKTNQLHGAGLRLGSINNDPLNPVIVVRNLGTETTTVNAVVPFSKQDGSTGKVALPQLSLAPGEIKLFDASNAQLKQNNIATAGLEIEYKGAAGSVIASAHSVSRSGNQVFELPMKDPEGGMSSTGGYPWFINGSSSTVVFIKNTTTKPQDFILSVIFPGGHWNFNHPYLAPGQTIAVDIKKLRDTQEKGSTGEVIPLNATVGHISWSSRGATTKTLIGRAQTVDFSKGLASTYECQCGCSADYRNSRIEPERPTVQIDQVKNLVIYSRYYDCFGRDLGEFRKTDTWAITYSSNDPNVVIFRDPVQIVGVAPGSAGISAEFPELAVAGDCGYDPSVYCYCTNTNITGRASEYVTVQGPTVTIASNLIVVPRGDYTDVQVSVSPSNNTTSIQLRLTTQTGSGEARFQANNSNTLNITNSSTVGIRGITESSTKDNIELGAYVGNTLIAYRNFSVVWVTLSLRTSGEVSDDNQGKMEFSTRVGTTALGTFVSSGTSSRIPRTAVEIVGNVTPANLTESVTLRRTINTTKTYNDTTEIPSAKQPGDPDDSDGELLDTIPQSGGSMGKVYDLDAPGIGSGTTSPLNTIYRHRVNFAQYATVQGYRNGNTVQLKCSDDFLWFTRLSSIKVSNTAPQDNILYDVENDCEAGAGTTRLTWDLSGSPGTGMKWGLSGSPGTRATRTTRRTQKLQR